MLERIFADYPSLLALFDGLFSVLWISWPIWLPIILFIIFVNTWLPYVRMKFINGKEKILLELHLPKEINKSPKAMEIFLNTLNQAGAISYMKEAWIDGSVRPWTSLELVSIEGEVHFFIWTWKKSKRLIEAQIYAQYPTVEIHEVDDYTARVEHSDRYQMWGSHFKLSKADPYPIKTYVDYGLDKDPKEELKIDPMTAPLEYLGSLGKGEQAWIQILVMAHKEVGFKEGYFFKKKKDWKEEGKKIIEDIVKKTADADGKTDPNKLSPGEKDTIAAIERNIADYPFEVMIRGFYIAEKEDFDATGIGGLIGSFRQYGAPGMNGFKPGWFTDFNQANIFDHEFLDPKRRRRNKMERDMLDAYKQRSFFHEPYRWFQNEVPYILTSQELATIFHLPGGVATTPTFKRVLSKKVEAPTNLPQ